jgi:uncharacterized protein (TIGR02466 family)
VELCQGARMCEPTISLFSSPIWQFDFQINFKKAIEEAYDIQKNNRSVIISNVGGYQSPNIDVKKHFPELFAEIAELLQSISAETEMNLVLDNSWININKTGDFNKSHCHPLASMSAVFYLKSQEDSGNIVFSNPTLAMHYPINTNNKYFWGTYWFPPIQGRLFIFPSYLKHLVEQNKNKEDRISLALNFSNKKD